MEFNKKSINLFAIVGKSSHRRDSIVRQLSGKNVNVHFIDAIYLNEPASSESNLTVAEQGCALAHQSAYKSMEEVGCDFGLIIEDDAILDDRLFMYDWTEIMDRFDVLVAARSKISYVEFKYSSWIFPLRRSKDFNGLKIGEPYKIGAKGAAAYFINKKAASLILRENKLATHVADDWPFFSKLFHYVEVRPLLAFENFEGFGSEIELSRSGVTNLKREVGARKFLGRILKGLWLRVLIRIK